jgi:ElaB/YqjD/DUF883 family membrane-anchored ribosome-binding protein
MAVRKQRRRRNGANQANGRMRAVRADINALQHDMRDLVSDIGGTARREVKGAVEGAVEKIETLAQDNIDNLRDAVRSQPIRACALSIGAGALLGALLMR